MTPLLLAIQMGHEHCAKLLIQNRKVDIDVNERCVLSVNVNSRDEMSHKNTNQHSNAITTIGGVIPIPLFFWLF